MIEKCLGMEHHGRETSLWSWNLLVGKHMRREIQYVVRICNPMDKSCLMFEECSKTVQKQIQRIPSHTSDWLIEILRMKISTFWVWLTYLFIRRILDITWCTFYKHFKECNTLCIFYNIVHSLGMDWNTFQMLIN